MARQSLGAAPREQGSEVKGAVTRGLYLDSKSAEERGEEMIDVKLLGPKDDQWAVISLGSQWLATTRAVYAEAVKAAIAEAIAKQSTPSI